MFALITIDRPGIWRGVLRRCGAMNVLLRFRRCPLKFLPLRLLFFANRLQSSQAISTFPGVKQTCFTFKNLSYVSRPAAKLPGGANPFRSSTIIIEANFACRRNLRFLAIKDYSNLKLKFYNIQRIFSDIWRILLIVSSPSVRYK